MSQPKKKQLPESLKATVKTTDSGGNKTIAFSGYFQQCKEVILDISPSYRDFLQLRTQLFADAQPMNAIEGMLVDRLVALVWRLRRTHRIEREIMDRIMGKITAKDVSDAAVDGEAEKTPVKIDKSPDVNSLTWLWLYESQLDRSVYRALDELRIQQRLRTEREQPSSEQQTIEQQNDHP